MDKPSIFIDKYLYVRVEIIFYCNVYLIKIKHNTANKYTLNGSFQKIGDEYVIPTLKLMQMRCQV